jgi:hypothetical protein
MTNIIYPPRNLPGEAEPWGRAIEGVISDTRRTMTQVQQTLGNDGRSTSGQLAVISRQLGELSARFSSSVPISELSVTGSATIEPFPRDSINVTLPGTEITRTARIDLTGVVQESPAPGGALLWLRAVKSGNILWQSDRGITPNYMSAPAEWGSLGGTFLNASFYTVVPAGNSYTFTLEGVRTAFTGTPSTLSFTGGIATITYGAPA